jgi:hypothetical protein
MFKLNIRYKDNNSIKEISINNITEPEINIILRDLYKDKPVIFTIPSNKVISYNIEPETL